MPTTKAAVTIRYRKMDIPKETAWLGVERDRNAESVEFTLPRLYQEIDLSTKEFLVETMNEKGGLFDSAAPQKTVTDEEIRLRWTVGALPASASGVVRLRLRALSKDFAWQTETGEFYLAPTFAQGDPPSPPGQSYFEEALLKVAEGRDQAGTSAAAAKASADRAEATAGNMASNVASKWAFCAEGASVSVRPMAGSPIAATASQAATLTFNGAAQTVAANATATLTAAAGVNALSVSAGTLRVLYNRDSMDVVDALTAPASATGPIAQLYPVEGLPLGVTARVAAAQSGAGDPSPDNVRPIAGKNAVNMGRCGKNLYNRNIVTFANNPVSTAHSITDGTIRVLPAPSGSAGIFINQANGIKWFSHLVGQSYVYSFEARADASITLQASFLATSRVNFNLTTAWARYSISVASLPEVSPTVVSAFYMPATNTNTTPFEIRNIQVELGSAATAYEPYTGNTYAVASPETLYGLTGAPDEVDLTSGKITKRTRHLSVDSGMASSIIGPYNTSSGFSQFNITIAAKDTKQNGGIISSHFKSGTTSTGTAFTCHNYSGGAAWSINFRTNLATKADVLAWLDAEKAAGRAVQFVYEIETPQTLTVAPTIIASLPGLNQVYTDGGGDATASGRESLTRLQSRVAALEARAG